MGDEVRDESAGGNAALLMPLKLEAS